MNHDSLCDDIAQRLRKKGRYTLVDREVPFYRGNKVVFVADIVGYRLTGDGWESTPYEVKTGCNGRKKALKQERSYYSSIDSVVGGRLFASNNFIYISRNGVERWRRDFC